MCTRHLEITVTYRFYDFTKSEKFHSLADARKFAHEWVGAHPEMGITYAVCEDGVGRITVVGCSISELFPPAPPPIFR